MSDHRERQRAATHPPVPPAGNSPPPVPLPAVEQDLGIVEWLHCWGELPGECTGYLCDALLQWALLGGTWQERVPPALHPGSGHQEVLAELHDRWLQRALAEPIGRRLELATIGRLLGAAVSCGRAPQPRDGARRWDRSTWQVLAPPVEGLLRRCSRRPAADH